jgi:hypothetical protein
MVYALLFLHCKTRPGFRFLHNDHPIVVMHHTVKTCHTFQMVKKYARVTFPLGSLKESSGEVRLVVDRLERLTFRNINKQTGSFVNERMNLRSRITRNLFRDYRSEESG